MKSKLRVAVVILSVLKCLLWCIEKCLKYINKQAYIQTGEHLLRPHVWFRTLFLSSTFPYNIVFHAHKTSAIFGYSFCKAARQGFFLILRNALRITAVSVVSQLVLFIGKVFITVASAVGGSYIFFRSFPVYVCNFTLLSLCFPSYSQATITWKFILGTSWAIWWYPLC